MLPPHLVETQRMQRPGGGSVARPRSLPLGVHQSVRGNTENWDARTHFAARIDRIVRYMDCFSLRRFTGADAG